MFTADLLKEASGFFGVVQGLAADPAAEEDSPMTKYTIGSVAAILVVGALLRVQSCDGINVLHNNSCSRFWG